MLRICLAFYHRVSVKGWGVVGAIFWEDEKARVGGRETRPNTKRGELIKIEGRVAVGGVGVLFRGLGLRVMHDRSGNKGMG